LDRFDEETVQQLGEEDRKVVLQLSALLRAQLKFIEDLDPSKAAAIFDQFGSTSAKDDDDDDDGENESTAQEGDERPEWTNYWNRSDVFQSAGTWAMGAGAFGGSCGVVSMVCGPAFAAGGALAGGTLEYGSQVEEYQNDLRNWCEQGGNSHTTCNSHLP
jgi:hypothetical protein